MSLEYALQVVFLGSGLDRGESGDVIDCRQLEEMETDVWSGAGKHGGISDT